MLRLVTALCLFQLFSPTSVQAQDGSSHVERHPEAMIPVHLTDTHYERLVLESQLSQAQQVRAEQLWRTYKEELDAIAKRASRLLTEQRPVTNDDIDPGTVRVEFLRKVIETSKSIRPAAEESRMRFLDGIEELLGDQQRPDFRIARARTLAFASGCMIETPQPVNFDSLADVRSILQTFLTTQRNRGLLTQLEVDELTDECEASVSVFEDELAIRCVTIAYRRYFAKHERRIARARTDPDAHADALQTLRDAWSQMNMLLSPCVESIAMHLSGTTLKGDGPLPREFQGLFASILVDEWHDCIHRLHAPRVLGSESIGEIVWDIWNFPEVSVDTKIVTLQLYRAYLDERRVHLAQALRLAQREMLIPDRDVQWSEEMSDVQFRRYQNAAATFDLIASHLDGPCLEAARTKWRLQDRKTGRGIYPIESPLFWKAMGRIDDDLEDEERPN